MYRCMTIDCRNRFPSRGSYCDSCESGMSSSNAADVIVPPVSTNVVPFDGRPPVVRRIADLEKRIEELEEHRALELKVRRARKTAMLHVIPILPVIT